MNHRPLIISPAVLLLAFVTIGRSADADLVAINNAGFEDPPLADGGFTLTVTDWTNSGSSGTFNPGSGAFPGGAAAEGGNVAFSDGPTISQVLSESLAASTRYTLTAQIGNRLDLAFSGYEIQLLAGGVLLAQDLNSVSPGDGEFLMATTTYVAPLNDPNIGQALEVRLLSGGSQAIFDDIQLDASAVPEPSSLFMGLLGLSLFCCLLRRRTGRTVSTG